MRRNHVNDKDLLDKIERRLAEGTPTGFEIVDDLADSVPRADPRFMDELEARLMIRFQSRETEEEREKQPMQAIYNPPKVERLPRPVFKPSLTLIAAILVMVIVGAALLLINNGSTPDLESGAGMLEQDSTVTPTPTAMYTFTPVPSAPPTIPPNSNQLTATAIIAGATGTAGVIEGSLTPSILSPTVIPENQIIEAEITTPTATIIPPHTESIPVEAVIMPPSSLRLVVIAARDLPQGTLITQEDVILTYWPADLVPDGSFDGLASLVQMHITHDIPRWQPVVVEDVQ